MLQIVWNIIKYVYGLFYALVRPLKRVVCRRRKLSTSEDSVPLTSVATGNLRISTPQQYGDEQDADLQMEAWDSWDNPTGRSGGGGGYGGSGDAHLNGYRGKPSLGVSSIQNYHYNQQMQQQQQLAEHEEEPNFFEDMTPTVKKQTKILIRKKEEETQSHTISSRLAVMADAPMVTSELEAWQEEGGNAWENEEAAEDLTWQAEEAIKETRRKERAQRAAQHQRRKQQKEQEKGRGAAGGSLATRVS